jgi:hypothetical protein
MSTNACIRRQEWAIELKHIITLEHNIKVEDHSLVSCLSCEQGKAVQENPDKFINRDFLILKEKQIQLIRKRGWIFKRITISYDSLFDTFNSTMINIKSERSNRNGKGKGSIFNKGKRERITRFIRKHRSFTRGKSNILPSIRIKFEIRKRFNNCIRNNK